MTGEACEKQPDDGQEEAIGLWKCFVVTLKSVAKIWCVDVCLKLV